ncbi:MAG: UDP-glucose 4-epimerase GalE [Oligoflexia bacterium]
MSKTSLKSTRRGPILITGGAGYIGSHTHHELIAQGFEVVVYDNLSTGFQRAVHPRAHFVQGDIHDEKLLAQVASHYQISGVIHFAASLLVGESVEKPLDYYWNNTAGLLSVLRALREAETVPFVFSSTAATYGEPSSNPIPEDTLQAPINPYGRSKLFSEVILREHADRLAMGVVILRYFNVAGARMDLSLGQMTRNATHLIKVACEVALGRRKALEVFGTDYPTRDGTGVRDYIHVDDLARAHVAALQYLWDGGKSDVFNCGYGHGASVLEVIRAFEKITQKLLPHQITGRRPGDPAELVADASRLKRILGWKPQCDDLEKICRSALEWERNQGVRLEG